MVTKKDKYLAAAQKLLERGSLDKALAEFLKVAQEDQKDTRTWLRIAEIHVKRGEADQATEVYLKTAELYVEQGFFQRAVAVYKNVLKLTPGHTDAHFKLADVYKQLGLLLGRRAAIRSGGLRVPASRTAERGHLRPGPDRGDESRPGDVAGAPGRARRPRPETMRTPVASSAERPSSWKSRARLDDYLRVAERLLALQPENFALARKLAVRHLERQNPKAALAKLQPCFNADDKDADTLSLLANTFEQLGQTDKTLSVLKQLAKVYEDRRMQTERSQTIQRILSIDPSDALGNQRKERGREDRSPATREDGKMTPRATARAMPRRRQDQR